MNAVKAALITSTVSIRDLRLKLDRAKEALEGFEAEYSSAALDATIGVQGAENRLAGLENETAAAARLVKTLSAAIKEAGERDAAKLKAAKLAMQKTQTRTATAHLGTRDKAAEAFAASLLETLRQDKELIDHSAAVVESNPISLHGPPKPCPGGSCVEGELQRLVELEVCRASAAVGISGFP